MKHVHRQLLSQMHNRGMTLVELMIVVAIVGILAALAGVAFNNQLTRTKITRLEQYANDIKRGQEDFRARHNSYYPLSSGTTATKTYAADKDAWKSLLGFTSTLTDVQMELYSGSGSTCSSVPLNGCDTTNGALVWFVLIVRQNLGGAKDAIVIHSNGLPSPMIVSQP